MNRGLWIVLGSVLTIASSWLGLVVLPYLQLRQLDAIENTAGIAYPQPLGELATEGRKVYIANGCIYCHSQQVRGEGYGVDIQRNWGTRRTVPRDYIYESPVLLGTMRTGPDLSNVGLRWSADWQHKHLYNPRMMSPGSIMPSFSFLYEARPIGETPSPDALILSGSWAPEPGQEIVPTQQAKALVEYLLSLNRSVDLPEAHE